MNEKLLEENGWTVECESPFEIRHEDGSFATGQAAQIVVIYLEEEAKWVKCHYCEKQADRTLVWLKDKRQQPARIQLPWCGCDLMVALRKFWPCPYQVQEGVDYEVEEHA
jgi:hypothetical protein